MAILSAKATQLAAAFNFTPVLALVSGDLSSYTVTANSTTNELTATGHDFVAGVPVSFSNVGGGLPDGISSSQTYFVINPVGDTFQISESISGSPVDITSSGSGTTTVTEMEMGDEDNSGALINEYADASLIWDIMVRHEVDYKGAGRVSFSWGVPSVNTATNTAQLATSAIAIIPITETIDCRYVVVLRGANTITGNALGSVEICQDVSRTISLQGDTFSFTPTMT
jgi:hypothetical protein